MNNLMVGVVISLLLALAITSMELKSKVNEVSALQANISMLANTKLSQDETISRLTEASLVNARTIDKYKERLNLLQREGDAVRLELVRLRATEAVDALQRPFKMGVATDKRIKNSLKRFQGVSKVVVNEVH